MEKKSKDFSMDDAKKLAQTPEGRQLLAALQTQHREIFEKAALQTKQGDWKGAAETLQELLSSADMQTLLKKLGR